MRVTVCQLPPPDGGRDRAGSGGRDSAGDPEGDRPEAWRRLADHVRREGSDLVLLPEMPFHRWLPADPEPDPGAWRAAVTAHDRWMDRLDELGAELVAGSRPALDRGRRTNEGFLWSAETGYRAVQRKRHLPDEPGFREASWYEPGPEGPFRPVELADGLRVGFLICTDLWFSRHARELRAAGAHLILCPRATPAETREKWIVGGRAAAIVSGAWCLSSNRAGVLPAPGDGRAPEGRTPAFAGTGWIVEPEAGELRGTTDEERPFLTVDLDPAEAEAAKHTYPRYVE